MTSPRVQGDIPRFFESRVIGRRHLLMTYHIHSWEFPHLSKWPLFNGRRTISEDCEIEFVVLECDIDAVDNENHSVDYLGIETYQFEPKTSSDCTVSASDSVNNTVIVSTDSEQTQQKQTAPVESALEQVSTTRLQNVQVSLALGLWLCVIDSFCRQMNQDRMIFGDSAVNSKSISYKFCKA